MTRVVHNGFCNLQETLFVISAFGKIGQTFSGDLKGHGGIFPDLIGLLCEDALKNTHEKYHTHRVEHHHGHKDCTNQRICHIKRPGDEKDQRHLQKLRRKGQKKHMGLLISFGLDSRVEKSRKHTLCHGGNGAGKGCESPYVTEIAVKPCNDRRSDAHHRPPDETSRHDTDDSCVGNGSRDLITCHGGDNPHDAKEGHEKNLFTQCLLLSCDKPLGDGKLRQKQC